MKCPRCGGAIIWTSLDIHYCGNCYETWNEENEPLEEIRARKEEEDDYAD